MRHLRREKLVLTAFNTYLLSVLIDTCYNLLWVSTSPDTAHAILDACTLVSMISVMGSAISCLIWTTTNYRDRRAAQMLDHYCISFCALLALAALKKVKHHREMKIGCWNVAGIRACLKKGALDWTLKGGYDVFCMQETKAEEHQVEPILDVKFKEAFPFRYWKSCNGEGLQRKGLNGTSIWSKRKPIREIPPPEEDKEGRVTAVEFTEFNLVTVYTPNSQCVSSERFLYRVHVWDKLFREYVGELNKTKPTIVCGDFNVARNDIDLYQPDQVRNMCAGFLNAERNGMELLHGVGLMDAYRTLHPDVEGAYTFWDQKLPFLRRTNRGWRIDYFLVADNLITRIKKCRHHKNILGSDHCPLTLVIKERTPRLKIVESF